MRLDEAAALPRPLQLKLVVIVCVAQEFERKTRELGLLHERPKWFVAQEKPRQVAIVEPKGCWLARHILQVEVRVMHEQDCPARDLHYVRSVHPKACEGYVRIQ